MLMFVYGLCGLLSALLLVQSRPLCVSYMEMCLPCEESMTVYVKISEANIRINS